MGFRGIALNGKGSSMGVGVSRLANLGDFKVRDVSCKEFSLYLTCVHLCRILIVGCRVIEGCLI